MGIYSKIATLAESQNWEVKYDLLDAGYVEERHSLALKKNWNPISIREIEWTTIRDFVARHNLSRGYELATGVGLSSMAAACGMLDNGMPNAHLLTMDAYIEENRSGSLDYAHENPICYEDADGYKSVQQLIKFFRVQNIVHAKVGWSPDNTVERLSEVFDLEHESLDYIFIDGQHYINFVLADLEVVLPYVQHKNYAIFLHDTHAPTFEPFLTNYLNEKWGKSYRVLPGCGHMENGFNLSVITDLE